MIGIHSTEKKNHFYPAFYQHVLDYINANGLHYTGWGWWVESNPNRVDQPMPGLIGDWTGKAINGGGDHPRRPPETSGHSDRVRGQTAETIVRTQTAAGPESGPDG